MRLPSGTLTRSGFVPARCYAAGRDERAGQGGGDGAVDVDICHELGIDGVAPRLDVEDREGAAAARAEEGPGVLPTREHDDAPRLASKHLRGPAAPVAVAGHVVVVIECPDLEPRD